VEQVGISDLRFRNRRHNSLMMDIVGRNLFSIIVGRGRHKCMIGLYIDVGYLFLNN
jgi:hypothetical protein